MDEKELLRLLTNIRKGSKVAVVPLSTAYGDDINAIGIPCGDGIRSSIELTEPFHAILENFDGENLWLRTKTYYCLKVSIGDVKDIIPLVNQAIDDEE